MKTDHIKAIVESLLFASGVPLPLRRLVEVAGATKAEVKAALAVLRAEYTGPYRGVRLREVAGGYQFRTVADYADYVKALGRDKPVKLSRAALETLAIIAYRQPLTKIEIEAIRGVDVDGVLNSLLTRKLITVLGRKDVPGRPWIYGTSQQFLEVFNLESITDLPPLPDIHEPTANAHAEDSPDPTAPEDPESGRDLFAAGSGAVDPGRSSPGKWTNGHASGNNGGPATGSH